MGWNIHALRDIDIPGGVGAGEVQTIADPTVVNKDVTVGIHATCSSMLKEKELLEIPYEDLKHSMERLQNRHLSWEKKLHAGLLSGWW